MDVVDLVGVRTPTSWGAMRGAISVDNDVGIFFEQGAQILGDHNMADRLREITAMRAEVTTLEHADSVQVRVQKSWMWSWVVSWRTRK